ncbi:PREDICTED: triacylglycerol lipase 2-like isoform X1 [Lupinus angustifolius]|uniref:triacylglycerol lipase 2-like isoform X1 n=1 Tax=Lupinus angustifolius TaxID=3871 RepID=UPI00092E3777|nr:PREDICTED: triacylglycerol lipase 2-like isoform X1 [Lupinus angustifolius]
MANFVVSLFSIIVLLSITASTEKRKEVNAYNEFHAPSPDSNDGICKTMVETQGYTCQEHKVTTEDGYILSLQRMPAGLSGKTAYKPPVLLLHGVFIDAVVWVFNSPNESLAFILADNGFDVWLVSTRGTKYSRGHRSLTTNDKAYWEWTLDELATYDFGSSVEYVYNHTGKQMHFVGHSLGTLMALCAFSQQKQQLLKMLRSAALLSPIAHVNLIPSQPARFAAEKFVADDLYWLGIREFIPKGDDAAKFLKRICHSLKLNCKNLLSIFTGANCCVNSSRVDVFLENEPQPSSTKNLIHLSQMLRTGVVKKYDYGNEEKNMQHYGKASPPLYDMTNIPKEFPLFLSYGGHDLLADAKDVKLLLNDLKDHDLNKLVILFIENYAHADFIMGVNANKLVYHPIMTFFKVN